MRKRPRSIRQGMIRQILAIRPYHLRAAAWQAFHELPDSRFNQPGSQAVHRERRQAANVAFPFQEGRR